jgi:hypothetical protein
MKLAMIRTRKIEKFIQLKVDYMEGVQRSIEMMKQQHGYDDLHPVIQTLHINLIATYNYTFDLCREVGIDMPHVLGVTPS